MTDKLKGFFLAGMKSETFPLSLTSPGHFGIGTADGCSMSGHIKFRKNHDMTLGSIRHYFAYIVLGIELSRCLRVVPVSYSAFGGKLRILLDFDSPARFVSQMPVKNIQLQRSHHVKILLDLLLTKEMTAFVEHKASPGIPRSIFNPATSDFSSSRLS